MTTFQCGPQTESCRCTCGYVGERVCDHVFEGNVPLYDSEGRECGGTSVCKCGLTAMDHSLWIGD